MEREITRLKEAQPRSPYMVRGKSLLRRDSSIAGAALLAGQCCSAASGSAPFSSARNMLASPIMRPSRPRALVTEPPGKGGDPGSVQSAFAAAADATVHLHARQGSLWVPPSK
jgi:hypothetical protein